MAAGDEVSVAAAEAVAAGVAGELVVAALWLRATTKTAINTTPTMTARTTRDEDFWFATGALGVTGATTTGGATTLIAESTETTGEDGVEMVEVLREGTAGITMRLATFLALGFLAGAFFATFLAGAFFATFLAGAFFATFLAGAFFATFLAETFLAETFLAGAFLAADFLAVFLTATGDSSVKSDRSSDRDGLN